ncbi:putative nuclease HARBI1 [Dioscorea cayenensis subsp. rotundata]|uniref:Nuclease HARBI1 n=1 Tax=Dioscorea cayennensis subsp. rotundata TaxID=55577 RepID=A0AB40BNV0_DIOCR|nr:putative nuclease HARBI1 [Dioscorea cayenensis subsp. rotundata]
MKLHSMQHLATAQVVIAIISSLMRRRNERRQSRDQITREIRIEGDRARDELMSYLLSSDLCHSMIRMSSSAFLGLCDMLVRDGGLRATLHVSVEEQVAKTLYVLGHNVTHRELSFFFRRSRETTFRHFHNVLQAIIELEDKYLTQPDGSQIPSEIFNSNRFHPYFKDCIGAIDGTHIRVKVPSAEAPKYRGRKDYPTQNVLAACTFDLKFTYVLPGWEGTTSDSRIIKNALIRPYPLRIPEGKYYLVDAGFMLRRGLITPYRGERYHLKEYSRNPPRNPRELFNLRHASLRSAIERAFGVLKKRFPIIASSTEPHYGLETHKEIIFACCILHNYLMGVDPDEALITQVDNEIRDEAGDEYRASGENNEETIQGEIIRDEIAVEM